MISNYKIRKLSKELANLTTLTYRIPSAELGIAISRLHMVNLLPANSQYEKIREILHGFRIIQDNDHHILTISSLGDNGGYIRHSFSTMLMQGFEPINPKSGDSHILVDFIREIFEDNNNAISGNFKIKDAFNERPVEANHPYYFTDDLFTPLYNHVGLQVDKEKSSVVIDSIKLGWSSAFKPSNIFVLEHDTSFTFTVRLGHWIMHNVDKLKETGLNHMGLFVWMLNKKEDFSVAT